MPLRKPAWPLQNFEHCPVERQYWPFVGLSITLPSARAAWSPGLCFCQMIAFLSRSGQLETCFSSVLDPGCFPPLDVDVLMGCCLGGLSKNMLLIIGGNL